jgi:hypothetical protein
MKRNVRYLIGVAAVAAVAMMLMPATDAACGVAKLFGQAPQPVGGYFYIFMPTNSTNSNTSIIGRLWEQGARATDNEGTGCPDDVWVLVCNFPTYPCGGNPTGKTRYLRGVFSGSSPGGFCDPTGCPTGGDLDVVVQDTTTDGGSVFFMARVLETPATVLAYDFSQIGQNLAPVELRRPTFTDSDRVGTTINVDMTLSPLAPNTGFYSFPTQPVTGNISGYRIHTFTGTADPGRSRTAWVADSVVRPYTGADVTITDLPVNCANTTQDVFVAVALEFDNGALASDYVSRSMRVECDPNVVDPNRFRMIEKPKKVQPR